MLNNFVGRPSLTQQNQKMDVSNNNFVRWASLT